MLAQIQVSPRPSGTDDDRYAYVDAAIAVIQRSGLGYEVGAMGTTIEGTPDQLWPLLREVHEATVRAGATGVSSVIKVAQTRDDDGPTIRDLVGKFRGLTVRGRRVLAPLAAGVVLLVGWEVGVRASGLPGFVLPPPSQVAVAAVRVAPLIGPDVATTLTEAGLGLLVGAVVGLLLAVLIGVFPVVRDTVYPLVTLTQTIPTVVLAPLLILWAGFGLLPKVVLVALTAFFPVLVAAVTAMAALDAEHAEMIAGLGGTRRHQFWIVQLPASVPGALGGLRVAATYAIGAAVVAEYLAGQRGLGVFIQRSRKGYEVDQVLVAVVLVAVLTGLLFLLVDGLARLATPWQRAATSTRPGRTTP